MKIRQLTFNFKPTKKASLITLILSSFFVALHGQSGFVTTGAELTGSGGSVSASIGLVNYTNWSGNGILIGQGNQQPYEILTNSVKPITPITVALYPNPVWTDLHIKLSEIQSESLSCEIYSLKGNLIATHRLSLAENTISLAGLSAGAYLIKITKHNQNLFTSKIIKN